MKYIISEHQLNFLNENIKISSFQNVLDICFAEIKNHCEDIDSETFPSHMSFSTCDNIESLDNIKILSVNYTDSVFVINVQTQYTSIFPYTNFDPVLYDLSTMMKKYIGTKINLVEEESVNTRKSKEW
jgi:hypothetical protein